jgi:hypothetical protein
VSQGERHFRDLLPTFRLRGVHHMHTDDDRPRGQWQPEWIVKKYFSADALDGVNGPQGQR